MDAQPPLDEYTIEGDTPTHRLHMMQMSITAIQDWIARLQQRRTRVVEKIKKAKANTAVARTLTVDKRFARLVKKMEINLEGIEEDISKVADDLNRARALFFEASGGEVIIEKEQADGS